MSASILEIDQLFLKSVWEHRTMNSWETPIRAGWSNLLTASQGLLESYNKS